MVSVRGSGKKTSTLHLVFSSRLFRNDEQKKCTCESPETGRMEITRRRCERPGGGTGELAFHQMTITKKKKKSSSSFFFLIHSNALK